MSDFTGMGGALTVCLIAQSIVFTALAVMAGVIYLVGILAGEKNKFSAPVAVPLEAAQTGHPDEMDEITAAMTAVALEELKGRVDIVKQVPNPGNNLEPASPPEAAQRGNLK